MVTTINYRSIDLEKAKDAPNAGYTLRLLFMLNDLLGLKYLDELIDSERISQPELICMQDGVTGYVLRVQEAHIVEAVEAFIKQMPGLKTLTPGSVHDVVEKCEKLKALADEISALTEDDKYKKLEYMRNTFTFHYNYKKEGSVTQLALEQYIKDLKDSETGVAVGKIAFDGKGAPYRFCLADKVLDTAWRAALGVTRAENYTECLKTQEIKRFIVKLGASLTRFANAWTLKWIADNQLAITEPETN